MLKIPEYVCEHDNYIHVDNVDEFVDSMFSSNVKLIALDTETYYDEGLARDGAITKWIRGTPNNKPFGVSIFTEVEGKRMGYWIDHDLRKLKPILECRDIEKILHNSKYDINMLANIGIQVNGKIWDTMAMAHLIDENMECRLPNGGTKRTKALTNLAYHFLDRDALHLEKLVDKTRTALAKYYEVPKSKISYKDVNDVAPYIMKDYAIADTEFCYDLFPIFLEGLKAQYLMDTYDIEMDAMNAVIAMERRGVAIDRLRLNADKYFLEKIKSDIVVDIDKIAKVPFNINSDNELVETFQNLGIKWDWFTEKGSYKTDEATLKLVKSLNKESDIEALCDLILEYRTVTKLLSTYIEGIEDFIQYDGRVHADFWLFPDDYSSGGTVTGRLSSSNPNLQNIPKKPIKIRGYEINPRAYFIADEGYRLVFQDARQQEYRVMAHYANDKNFMSMIHDGWDVHRGTASLIFDVPYEQVTDEQRDKAKTINFALIYGLSNISLANSLGYGIDEAKVRQGTGYLYKRFKAWELPPYTVGAISPETMKAGVTDPEILEGIEYFLTDHVQKAIADAVETKRRYFKRFPDIKKFIRDCSDVAAKRGFIIMWGGRIRHFKNPKQESYKAPNSLIQGSCAMIMKKKLAEIHRYMKGSKSGLVMSVHDEVITEVHESELYFVDQNNEILSDLDFRVPIGWDNEWGYNWGEKQEWKAEGAL